MLVFNQRSNSVISRGEMEFIEEMFEVDSRIQENKDFNVLQVNAGNGDGCNELYSWLQDISGERIDIKEIKVPQESKKTGCLCFT
jgi:hypothetical protein